MTAISLPDDLRILDILAGGALSALSAMILFRYWQDVRPYVPKARARYAAYMCIFGVLVGLTFVVVSIEIEQQNVGYTYGEFLRLIAACWGIFAVLPLMRNARQQMRSLATGEPGLFGEPGAHGSGAGGRGAEGGQAGSGGPGEKGGRGGQGGPSESGQPGGLGGEGGEGGTPPRKRR